MYILYNVAFEAEQKGDIQYKTAVIVTPSHIKYLITYLIMWKICILQYGLTEWNRNKYEKCD